MSNAVPLHSPKNPTDAVGRPEQHLSMADHLSLDAHRALDRVLREMREQQRCPLDPELKFVLNLAKQAMDATPDKLSSSVIGLRQKMTEVMLKSDEARGNFDEGQSSGLQRASAELALIGAQFDALAEQPENPDKQKRLQALGRYQVELTEIMHSFRRACATARAARRPSPAPTRTSAKVRSPNGRRPHRKNSAADDVRDAMG